MFGVRAGSTKCWAPCEKAEWAPFSIRVVGDRPSGWPGGWNLKIRPLKTFVCFF